MKTRLTWDETKRHANLAKHGLDFADADDVLESNYRLDVVVIRNSEYRTQSFSYVMNHLAVLSLVHVARDNTQGIISFRYANELEAKIYYDWIENQPNDA